MIAVCLSPLYLLLCAYVFYRLQTWLERCLPYRRPLRWPHGRPGRTAALSSEASPEASGILPAADLAGEMPALPGKEKDTHPHMRLLSVRGLQHPGRVPAGALARSPSRKGASTYTIAMPPMPKTSSPSAQIRPCRFRKYPV